MLRCGALRSVTEFHRYANSPTGTPRTEASKAGFMMKKIAIFNQYLALSKKQYKIRTIAVECVPMLSNFQ